MGCSGGGIIPTTEGPTVSPSALTQTVPGLESPSPTEFQPTPTETPTPEPTATATATKEPEIGGGKSVVLWMHVNHETHKWDSTMPMPPEFAPFLTPTTPEQWKKLETLTMDNGEVIPWGRAITFVDVGDTRGWLRPMVPGLVRGVVQYGMFQGLPAYGAIIEFPVKGGSVFWIAELVDYANSPNYSGSRLLPGMYPASCAGGATCALKDMLSSITDGHPYTQRELVRLLPRITGRMVLFDLIPFPEQKNMVDAIADGRFPTGTLFKWGLEVPEFWYPDSGSQ
jgi:hypothetical protein